MFQEINNNNVTIIRDNIIEEFRKLGLLLWEDDYERLADIAIFEFERVIDECISNTDQSDYQSTKLKRKILECIRDRLQ